MRKRMLSTLSVLFGLLLMTVAPALADDHGRHGRYDDPPGWHHGRKAGWGNCDLPPGLAKKHGCYPSGYRMVRYPMERGSFVVVRVPEAYRGWYRVDDRHQLWVDDRGYWRDNRAGVRLSFVIN
jgi:hypothetical protein